MQTKRRSQALQLFTLLTTGASYWLHINPIARREINNWRRRASTIPNDTLRAQASHKLTGERLNPEAAALFAILAAPRHRKRLIRLIVAFQIAYDYLDAVNEAPDTASVQNGLQLHQALNDAVAEQPGEGDYYRYHPHKDDGGYLKDLITVCRSEIAHLHSAPIMRQVLLTATDRVGTAQTRNHAVRTDGPAQLITWAKTSSKGPGYLWWELSAGGISSLGIHALFAVSSGKTTLGEATQLDSAYFPPVCAISALLDSLVDYSDDTKTSNHSFVDHYPTAEIAAHRFGEITQEALTLLGAQPHHRRHVVLLTGIAAFYLSAAEAQSPFARPVTISTLAQLGPITVPMLAAMRFMRRHAGVSSTQAQRPKHQSHTSANTS